MDKDLRYDVKKDIKWLKYAIKNFERHNNICYCWNNVGDFPSMEIAARYMKMKGAPLKLSYGTAPNRRDCYIALD